VALTDGTVGVIRTSDNALVDTIPAGMLPRGVVITPDGAFAYVANANDDTVSVIRISDNTVINTINVGDEPRGIDVTPDGAFVFCVNSGDNSISIIRTSDNQVVDTISNAFGGTIGTFIAEVPSISNPIPTLSEWGMIAAAAGLGLVGVFFVLRKRKAAV